MADISRFVKGLKGRHPEERHFALCKLLECVEDSEEVVNGLIPHLKRMVNSSDLVERMTALSCLYKLSEVVSEHGLNNLAFQFIQTISFKNLNFKEEEAVILASQTLGKLLSSPNSTTFEMAEEEFKYALSIAKADVSKEGFARLAACCEIKEMTQSMPILMVVNLSLFLGSMWNVLRDSKDNIRQLGIQILELTLPQIQGRDDLYERVLNDSLNYLTSETSVPAVHGSLLALSLLVKHAPDFVAPRFREIMIPVMALKEHKSLGIKAAVLQILPDLFNFIVHRKTDFLDCTQSLLTYLFVVANSKELKNEVMLLIGHLAMLLGSSFSQHESCLAGSVRIIRTELNKKPPYMTGLFELCRGVVHLVKGKVTDYFDISYFPGIIFNNLELNTYVLDCLNELLNNLVISDDHRCIAKVHEICEGLLSTLFNTLNRSLETHFILPRNDVRDISRGPSIKDFTREFKQVQDRVTHHNTRLLHTIICNECTEHTQLTYMTVLSLYTLANFDFRNTFVLTPLVHSCVLPYLEDPCVCVRQQAIITACELTLAKSYIKLGSVMRNEFLNTLERLLNVTLTDSSDSVRCILFRNLKIDFYDYLSLEENLSKLMAALNDRDIKVRRACVELLGSLLNYNSSYILPCMTQLLSQYLSEIRLSGSQKHQEHAALLLRTLITNTKQVILPNLESIVNILVSITQSSTSSTLVKQTLLGLSACAKVCKADILPYSDKILGCVIDNLKRTSHHRRKAALKTAIALVNSTSLAIKPYSDDTDLLPLLIAIIKTEEKVEVRKLAEKAIGKLGALDPVTFKNLSKDRLNERKLDTSVVLRHLDELQLKVLELAPSHDIYYPLVALRVLMKLLSNAATLTEELVFQVLNAVFNIFRCYNRQLSSLLVHVLPILVAVSKSAADIAKQGHFIVTFKNIASVVEDDINDFIPQLIEVIDLKQRNSQLLLEMLRLLRELASKSCYEMKSNLPQIIHDSIMIMETSEEIVIVESTLSLIECLKGKIDSYLYLVLPALIKTINDHSSMKLRKQAIRVISVLCNKRQNPHIEDFIARIVDCFVGIIKLESTELSNEVFESLAIIAENLGSSYAVYISPVQREMMTKRLSHPRYEAAVHQLIAVSEVAESVIGRARVSTFSFIGGANEPNSSLLTPTKNRKNSMNLLPYKNEIDVHELLEVCNTENLHTKEEWKDWMRRLANELLRQAPAPALRECQIIEENNNSLELFNASFVACWSDLFDDDKDQMLRHLESAFYSKSIPTEVLQVLLNLAEFMEHDDHKLFDARTLGDLAFKCKAYAKALHYKEVEFYTSAPSPKIIEALISLNNLLHQHEAAYGIRMYAKLKGWGDLSQAWVSEFHRWQDADELHEIINERLMADPAAAQQQELTLMRMKCLKALSNWARLLDLAESKWKSTEKDPSYRKDVAAFAAAASWNLGRWEQLNKYANGMDSGSFEHCFYSAIMSIHDGNYTQSKKVLDKAWDIVDNKLPGLLRESYVRAYPVVFEAQQLMELEEVIAYKSTEETPARRSELLNLWNSRLRGCQQSIDLWEKELSFRPLVVCPEEDLSSWLSFAKLFMKSEQLRLAGETMEALFLRARQDEAEGEYSGLYNMLFGGEEQVHPASICFVYLRYLHAQSSAGQALEYLKKFVSEQEGRLASGKSLSKYYLQLSKWQKADLNDVLHSLRKATEYDSDSVRAWHKWGLVNFELVSKNERIARKSSGELDRIELDSEPHIVSAIDGFSRSIAKDFRTGQRLQDTLRLITLWFKYGGKDNIFKKLKETLDLLDVEVWLQVIPQIIARASTPNALMRELIHGLLVKVSHHHPHSLLYHLGMAAKTSSEDRRSLATQVISEIRHIYPQLVEDTLLVTDELIRCAVLWKEAWNEAINEASHCAFSTNDYASMMDILKPLHAELNRGPETLSELAFYQAYSAELKEAESWLLKFQVSANEMDLQQAWNLYYSIYTKLHKMNLKTIDIENVSPKLTQARNLKAAMPGLHSESSQMVTIAHFDTKMEVFQTKQHPRRLNVYGNNGKEYKFLLKGHEDLRQDERAMQLFSLVNNLLSADHTTNSKDLAIKRFAVVPLSPTSGLIGWVHGSDTLNQLIQEYRQRKRIEVNVERDLIRSMYTKYDQLPLYNKIEIFEYAISQTKGEDLQKILWSKSPTSEIWLERRTNYTRSLATMSMVGYILGLGDRHPSNLMLDRNTGKIIHIDFGDCFEVAMKRERCPEKVPFRLTRMMLNAMEISGTEGNFRITCEQVMNVLRQNKDSLMAMLEVFLYDPLVSWRIITQETALPSHHDELDETANKDRVRKIDQREAGEMNQVLNKKALEVLDRIFQKLTGNDFPDKKKLNVPEQVERLISEAQSIKNLSQSYIGWCPFW